jgi:hypothetical protein
MGGGAVLSAVAAGLEPKAVGQARTRAVPVVPVRAARVEGGYGVPGVREEAVKKRWTLKLALCLLAGAVVTWGVAWGCALSRPPYPRARKMQANVAGGWRYVARSETRGADYTTIHFFAADKPYSDVPVLGVVPGGAEVDVFKDVLWTETYRFGWPLYAVCAVGANGTYSNGYAHQSIGWYSLREGTGKGFNPAFRPGALYLPTRPLPLGFALNTLFYAAVVLGVVEFVAFARRRVRRGRGRCPSCGYDRAGLAEGSACPECGGKE